MQVILVGGFLGAGKTTAIQCAIEQLGQKGIKAAVVTNDQGDQLADTLYLQGRGIETEQVTSGCFCCNFAELANALEELDKKVHPEIVFAESVGSCTDLIATVLKPMQQLSKHKVAGLSVFVDAALLQSQLLNQRFIFAQTVHYIFEKQLDEADIIVVNKVDKLSPAQFELLQQLAAAAFPGKKIMYQCSFSEVDISNWLDMATNFKTTARASLEIDYDIYGAGEAALAWLDASMTIHTANAPEHAVELMNNFREILIRKNWPIGHLKYIIKDRDNIVKISITSTGSDEIQSRESGGPDMVTLLINARVQCLPKAIHDVLLTVIDASVSQGNAIITLGAVDFFQPGYPTPTHRIEA